MPPYSFAPSEISENTSRTRMSVDVAPEQEPAQPKPEVDAGPVLRPYSHSWRDPAIAGMRKAYVKAILLGTFITVVAILGILSIYWGAFWRLGDYIHNLDGVVVDFDGGPIGSAVVEAFRAATGPRDAMTWRIAGTDEFPTSQSVIDYLLDQGSWAGVVINSGASSRLDAAVASANATGYSAVDAVTAYAEEARNENAYPGFIQPTIERILQRTVVEYAQNHTMQLAANLSSARLTTLASQAPELLTQPWTFDLDDMHPFDVPVAAAVDFVGLIYLLIISFLLTLLNYNARMISGLAKHLDLRSLIIIRIIVPLGMYFILSWFYSFVSLAFQVPFSRRFGSSGFVIYWCMSFLGMCALGLAIEAVITFSTPRFAPYFLILWIIANVSVSFYPIEMLPGIYRYGYASPFHNVAGTVRTILFSTKNQLGLNFGVQFAWIVVSFVTIPVFTWIVRRREERAWAVASGAGKPEAGKEPA